MVADTDPGREDAHADSARALITGAGDDGGSGGEAESRSGGGR